MTNPAAKDERFLAVAGDFMWMAEIAQALKVPEMRLLEVPEVKGKASNRRRGN